jgi:hypothetical protein
LHFHTPYFEHMSRLDSNFTKVLNVSGICHHMMFETQYIKQMFEIIESQHNDTFYNVFLKLVSETSGSGASEYEIYFNYMLKYHFDKMQIRELNWRNVTELDVNCGLDYISYHHYNRSTL